MALIELIIERDKKIKAREQNGRWIVNTYNYSVEAGDYIWCAEIKHHDFSVAWQEAVANLDMDLYFEMFTKKEIDNEV